MAGGTWWLIATMVAVGLVQLGFTSVTWAQEPAPQEPDVARAVEDKRQRKEKAGDEIKVAPPEVLRKIGNQPNPVVELPAFVARRAQSQKLALEGLASERLATVSIPETLRLDLRNLDDVQFAVREAASARLRDPTIPDMQIWAALDREQLPIEAYERLLEVARRRALEKPRGALGVRMGDSPPTRPGVLVQATLPGLPGEKILKIGDVIEKLDDQQILTTLDLADALQIRPPGQEVRLTVLRTERDPQGRPMQGADGKPVERRMEFMVALGNAAELDRLDVVEQRAAGGQNFNLNRNLSVQQREMWAAAIQQRFAKVAPVGAKPVDREPEPTSDADDL